MSIELSICIPTLNRAPFIGATLDSIVSQLVDGVEVVIVDGGSRDGTEEIVAQYAARFPSIRYFNRGGSAIASNAGFDRDCDFAVDVALGTHCWLMTDDDILKANAIALVLEGVRAGHDVVVVSCEVRDLQLKEMIVTCRPGLASDRVFPCREWEGFFLSVAVHLTFLGALVVRREVWQSRSAEDYFGTGFVHVGVLFREPIAGTALVLSEPLVVIRNGNNQWNTRAFDIFMIRWPALVWSFDGVSDSAKESITPREPWRLSRVLLLQRAFGRYTTREFQEIAPKLSHPWQRSIAAAIAKTPVKWLYWPARLYGWFKHDDPRYFNETLEEGRRASSVV